MNRSRIEALTRQEPQKQRMIHAARPNGAALRHGRASGPVHRAGPTYHDPALWQVADPGARLLAPTRVLDDGRRRAVRGLMLLMASFSLTPALPVCLPALMGWS